jgi:hypothetical protein
MDQLPEGLQRAMERLFEAGAPDERVGEAVSAVERIHALRTARKIIAEWRRGRMDAQEAIRRIEALIPMSRC